MKNIGIVILQELTERIPPGNKLLGLLQTPDAIALLRGTYHHRISPLVLRPASLDQQAIDYFREILFSIPPVPDRYMIYIGSDIINVTEMPGGVELPYRTLESQEMFRDEVLKRIRRFVGSPNDS